MQNLDLKDDKKEKQATTPTWAVGECTKYKSEVGRGRERPGL